MAVPPNTFSGRISALPMLRENRGHCSLLLAHSFGVTGSVFTWVQSYLTGRSQVVRLGSHSSNPTPCLVGVPQGSVLGPLLFTSLKPTIYNTTNDTQLFVALTTSNVYAQVSTLESCLPSLQTWFCANGMILNPDKSNSVLFATTQRAQLLPNQVSINIS